MRWECAYAQTRTQVCVCVRVCVCVCVRACVRACVCVCRDGQLSCKEVRQGLAEMNVRVDEAEMHEIMQARQPLCAPTYPCVTPCLPNQYPLTAHLLSIH